MKKAYLLYSIIISYFLLTSCEKVIDLDLPTAPARLVVEGNIDFTPENINDTLKIKLSLTTDYYNSNIPVVNNAIVWVERENGTTYTFHEMNNTGVYISTEVPKEINKKYKLHIEYDNDVYEANEILLSTPVITELKQTREKLINEDLYVLRYYFQDTPKEDGTLNYYYSKIERNNDRPYLSVISNEHSKGNQIEKLYIDKDTKVDDEINISSYQISRNYYNYLKQLTSNTNSAGGPFQVPPGQVKGNVKNLTSPDKQAFGYFRITEKQTYKHKIFEQPKP
ncbi:DUF4249 domain-containing protein [Myroides albus]|uniref:DUF4249 family protein n=1 Tax=Myroides albus TaxID=2562892 RepID=A0A6I3LII0_9FLAO|nr:DUF4249 domain-containing protein [Myroides albus]MTG98368.1 DUF4249 family protein [Myroides albus]UVD80361.1 DUF4249 domain-containing protein [Myroides albus]